MASTACAGSSIPGRLADPHGYTAAFAVTVSAMALAVVLVASSQRRLRDALAAPEPIRELPREPVTV